MLDTNKIYLGDCIKLMKNIEDDSIDLIIADPPYGIDKDFGINQRWNLDEHSVWFNWMKKWIKESSRCLKPGGSIFIYGIHHNIGYVQTFLYSQGLKYGRMFIWHYENSWSKYKKSPAATYEPLLWFHKGDDYTYNEMRVPYKSTERLKHKVIKNGKVWTPNPNGKMAGDVWDIPVLAGKLFQKERVNHPTQKPLAICDRIIKHFSRPQDIVLVPFAGSGSEVVSAHRNNRRFIGMELNPNYIKISQQRLNLPIEG